MFRLIPALILGALVTVSSGCGVLKKKEPTTDTATIAFRRDLSPDEAQELLGEYGENWLYGHGFGRTALNLGGILLFPPYGLYLLGNGLISAAGYEPVEVTDLLPEEEKKGYDEVYDGITSVPGRVSALIADEEFRSREVIADRMRRFTQEPAQRSVEDLGPSGRPPISREDARALRASPRESYHHASRYPYRGEDPATVSDEQFRFQREEF